MDLTSNPLLFGQDPTEGIVCIEPGKAGEMVLFIREGEALTQTRVPFRPFILIADPALLEGYEGETSVTELEGGGLYRWRVSVPDWRACQALERSLKRATQASPGRPGAPYLFLSDPVQQFMIATGKTLFKGMDYGALRRLQLDIEVYCDPAFEFPNAERDSDQIIVISVSDNQGFESVITAKGRGGERLGEGEMLTQLFALLKERDPDVIEGHNLFNFDLPYIEARAKRHKVPFVLGRSKKPSRGYPSRMQVAERVLGYQKYTAYGRHIVDTLFLAQLYDLGSRSLQSYSLKDVAKQLGVAPEGRTYINGAEISQVFDADIGRLLDYALDDVIETRAIGEVLGYSFFLQAQIFPYSYQNVIVRGNATRIDSLFIRAYLAAGVSIPSIPPGREFAGGYTDIFEEGILRRVLHVDVASLYPSIMLAFDVVPKGDSLGIFKKMLMDLKAFRLDAKARRDAAEDARAEQYWDALQGTFKILINSFYGYMGAAWAHFADPDAAARVTQKGRDLLHQMVEWLKDNDCRVIEADTDGIYFSVPEGLPEAEEAGIAARLSESLPEGISLELDGRYPAMFSYKRKNYALLKEDGGVIIKGSGLRSRSVERFQRDFMARLFRALLASGEEAGAEIGALFREEVSRIQAHRWAVTDFSRRETLRDSLATYQRKRETSNRPTAAAYELALASGRAYQPGDAISYYVTGDKARVKVFEQSALADKWDPDAPDENTAYYLNKLDDLYKKFEDFIVTAGGPTLKEAKGAPRLL